MLETTDTSTPDGPPGLAPHRRLLLLAWLGPLVLALDHLTKLLAVEHLRGEPRLTYLGDVLRIQYSENRGAFLGLGSSMDPELRFWVFIVAVGLLLAGILVFLLGKQGVGRSEAMGLALVASGGLSNWIDRVLNHGVVVDFLNVGIGPLRTGIFNVADMAITGGVILLAALSLGWGGPRQR